MTTSDPKWKPYATASRLSYALWDTMPDAELFAAAARGELATPQGVEKAARRMLDHPRAREALDEFVSQWLRFDRLLTASKDRRKYPAVHARDRRRHDRRGAHVCRRPGLERSQLHGSVHGRLRLRERRTGADLQSAGARRRSSTASPFPAGSERAGLLGQGLFLALTAKPEDSSPTARGLFVREQFLCQHVPDPPAGVNTNLPPVTEAKPQTNRDRMSEHATNPSCATCHKLIDPIGFGLEKFDAVGARATSSRSSFGGRGGGEGGGRRAPPKTVDLDIDTTGYVAGIPDSQFSSPAELGAVMAKSAQCQECVVKQYFRYTAGRLETPADRPADPQGAGRLSELAVPLQRAYSVISTFEGISKLRKGLSMSQVITNRVRISRRSLLKGLTAAGARIVVGLPPLVSMFNSRGHRLRGRPAGRWRREAHREPLRALVQRQRHSRSATGFLPRKAPTTT